MKIDDKLMHQLQTEFLDAVEDRTGEVEAAVDACLSGRLAHEEALLDVRRLAHTIKGSAASFGFPVASMIAHRLEDYIAGEAELSALIGRNILKFCDRIRDIARNGQDPGGNDAADIFRSLPVKQADIDTDQPALNVEVLVGTPSKVSSRIVRDTLQNCGYRVVQAENAMDCFSLAVRMRPDVMIFAQTLDMLSGAELARAFKAMGSTAKTPIAIFTSFDLSHRALQDLPDGVTVIRSGKTHFDEDMAHFLTRIQDEVL